MLGWNELWPSGQGTISPFTGFDYAFLAYNPFFGIQSYFFWTRQPFDNVCRVTYNKIIYFSWLPFWQCTKDNKATCQKGYWCLYGSCQSAYIPWNIITNFVIIININILFFPDLVVWRPMFRSHRHLDNWFQPRNKKYIKDQETSKTLRSAAALQKFLKRKKQNKL